jgi:MFS family permease
MENAIRTVNLPDEFGDHAAILRWPIEHPLLGHVVNRGSTCSGVVGKRQGRRPASLGDQITWLSCVPVVLSLVETALKRRAWCVVIGWFILSVCLADIGITFAAVRAVRIDTLTAASVLQGLGSGEAWVYVIAWVTIAFSCLVIKNAGAEVSIELAALLVIFAWSLFNYASAGATYHPSWQYVSAYFSCLAVTIFISGYMILSQQFAALKLQSEDLS